MNLPCSECKGRCCTYPTMTETEFVSIKVVHGLPPGTVVRKMNHEVSYDPNVKRGMVGVVLHLADGTCPYLKNGACSIYALRPKVCKDYGMVPDLPCEYLYPAEAAAKQQDRIKRSRL